MKKSFREARNLHLAEYYKSGKTFQECSDLENLTVARVGQILHRLGVEIRPFSITNRKYSYDEHYFDKIDTHAKAQILGFIAADGCISKSEDKTRSKILSIYLNRKDHDYLEFIKQEIKYTGPISQYTYKTKSTGKISDFSVLKISGDSYFNALKKLSIGERKSLTLEFPTLEQMPEEFIPSFIQGYFEGDGCIVAHEDMNNNSLTYFIQICVTKEFGERVKQIVWEKLGVNLNFHHHIKYRKRNLNAWTLNAHSNITIIKFGKWMYANTKFKMQRKYQKFVDLMNMYDANGRLIITDKWKEKYDLHEQQRIDKAKIDGKKLSGNSVRPSGYLISPEGQIYFLRGMKGFCEEFGLVMSCTRLLLRDKAKSSGGWRVPNEEQIQLALKNNSVIEKKYYPKWA